MVKNITDSQFDEEVLKASNTKLIIVDFWAPWCGPCRYLGPILEDISKEMADKVEIVKINVDENQINASKLAVRSIPAVFFFKNGTNVHSVIGLRPKAEFVSLINKLS